MSRRLLVIEGSSALLEPALVDLNRSSADAFEFDRIEWTSSLRESAGDCAADLIVPVAVPQSAEAVDFLRWLHEHPISKPTLAVIPDEAEEDLLRSAAEGADDFILWPLRTDELRHRIGRLIGQDEVEIVRSQLVEEIGRTQLVGNHPVFLRAIGKIPLVARSGAPLLITGETGTGKELCARAVHHLSCRRDFPFIPVDCSAMPDQLFENEVFGHVRGAFTDAHSEQKGLVAMAEKGTLFLDEIDSLSLPAQAKLLRFLQERAYKPLGADRFVRADVHVMTATNQDLEPSVQDGRFRRDLYFRLNVIELQLPPLRERRTDVELLANHFIRSFTAPETGGKRLSAAALRKLVLHEWPGNVRELSNVIQRAFVFCESAQILPWHISFPGTATASDVLEEDFRRARRRAVESFERGFVEESLRKHHGNVTRAALDAGKDRRAFGRLVKKYRIDRGEFEPGGH